MCAEPQREALSPLDPSIFNLLGLFVIKDRGERKKNDYLKLDEGSSSRAARCVCLRVCVVF